MLDNLVDALLNNLMALMPFVVIKNYQRGCRWKFGKNPEELQPGFHWRIYLYHEIEVMTVVQDAFNCSTQSVVTKDNKLVCFKVGFTYVITDVVKHYCNVNEFANSLIVMSKMHLAKKVRALTLEELTEDLTKLEASLKNTLTTKLKDWGTEVTEVGFVDFAEVPTQLRIFNEKD